MHKASWVFTVTLLLGSNVGCDDGDQTDADPSSQPDAGIAAAACPVMVDESQCDKGKLPIVFIHGSPGSGDNFAHPALLFASNGYCSTRIRAIEYNALADREVAYAELERETQYAIDELLFQTGKDQVDLIAHSGGTNHASRYVSAHPEKIAHYVHLAGGQLTTNPGRVPTLCISGKGDRPVECLTKQNEILEDETVDHFAVCSSTASFKLMYVFLNDGKSEPRFDAVQCGDPVVIEGKAVAFGDNERIVGGRVEVYELGDAPRERGAPVQTLPVRDNGTVGPWAAKRGVQYEWKLLAAEGDPRAPRYAYFQPWKRSDRLVRFLYESKLAGDAPVNQRANLTDETAALVIRHKQGAFLFGRDALLVRGTEAISQETAMPHATIVGMYVLDQNADGESGGGSILRSTFVNGTDMYLPTDPAEFIDVDFNGQHLQIPNWPSKTGGLSMVWFD